MQTAYLADAEKWAARNPCAFTDGIQKSHKRKVPLRTNPSMKNHSMNYDGPAIHSLTRADKKHSIALPVPTNWVLWGAMCSRETFNNLATMRIQMETMPGSSSITIFTNPLPSISQVVSSMQLRSTESHVLSSMSLGFWISPANSNILA